MYHHANNDHSKNAKLAHYILELSNKRQLQKQNNLSSIYSISRNIRLKKQTRIKVKNCNNKLGTFSICKAFNHYCRNTALHGLKYVIDTNRPIVDRLFWLGVFLASVVISSLTIYESWIIWLENPFVVVFDSILTPIHTIPFPAVTICSSIGVKKSVVDLNNITEANYKEIVSITCSGIWPPQWDNLTAEYSVNVSSENILNFMQETYPKCEDYIKSCIWDGNPTNCCSIFKPTLTSMGICYSFNHIPHDSAFSLPHPSDKSTLLWNPENGYIVSQNKTNYPKGVTASGENNSLTVILFQNRTEKQPLCSGARSGFQVTVGNVIERPLTTRGSLRVAMDQETLLHIIPKKLSSDPSMKSLKPKYRDCYYSNERRLLFYHYYSHQNCRDECLINNTYLQCNCIPFLMPRNQSIPMCIDSKQRSCAYDIELELKGMSDASSEEWCGCLPPCSDISYNVESHNSNFEKTEGFNPPWAENYICKPGEVTVLKVYFKSDYFSGIVKKRTTNGYTFLGSCCGLLGLFLGFSFISAFEVIYYFIFEPLTSFFFKIKTNKVTILK